MKQRNKEMEVDASPQHYSLCWPWGKSGSQQGCCGGGGRVGEASPTQGWGILCSNFSAAFCSFYLQKKKKKEPFFNLVGRPTLTHLSGSVPAISVFFLTIAPQSHGLALTCVSWPCLLSWLFHKAGWPVVSSKKGRRPLF